MPDIISSAIAVALTVTPPPLDAECRAVWLPGLDQFANTCPAPPEGKYRAPGGINAAEYALLGLPGGHGPAPWHRPFNPPAPIYPPDCCGGGGHTPPPERPPDPPAPVPLPMPGWLLLAALSGLVGIRYRRRSA